MQNPIFSFTVSFLIWLTILAAFSFSISQKKPMPQIALEIDASMVGEVVKEKKIATKAEVKKPDIDKSSDLKKAQEKPSQHDHHLSESEVVKKSAPLFSPLPQIPQDLREEAFSSKALARFYIAADGAVVKVELLKPCANPKLNSLLLKSLRNWKFAASATNFTQDIQVNFSVQ